MKLSDAWLSQIESDFHAIEKVYDKDDSTTYCQSIAKSQQVVEKAVKVMDVVIQELHGCTEANISYDRRHYPIRAINRLLYAPASIDASVTQEVRRTLGRNLADIHDVCRLAPGLPEVGDPLPRNTEYSYNVLQNDWQSPLKAFTKAEAARHRETAVRLREAAKRISTAALRLARR